MRNRLLIKVDFPSPDSPFDNRGKWNNRHPFNICMRSQDQNVKMRKGSITQLLKMTKALSVSGWCNPLLIQSSVSMNRTKEILTVLQEIRHLSVTHSRPRTTWKYMILNQTSAFIFCRTTSGGWLNKLSTGGRSASAYNQLEAFRCYESGRSPLYSFTLTNICSKN